MSRPGEHAAAALHLYPEAFGERFLLSLQPLHRNVKAPISDTIICAGHTTSMETTASMEGGSCGDAGCGCGRFAAKDCSGSLV